MFLNALLHLMKKKSFNNISVSELCKEANLSRQTFYVHFSCKEELLDYLITDFSINYNRTTVQRDYLQYFLFWYNSRNWVEVLIQNDLWEEMSKKFLRKYYGLLSPQNAHMMDQRFSKKRDQIFEFLNSGLMRSVYLWYKNDFQESPEEMAEMVEYILSGKMLRL